MSDAIARGGNSDFHADAENPPDDLRTRIAAAIRAADVMPSTDCDPYVEMADAVIAELLPKREGRWGWIDGTVSTNPQTGNPIKLEIEPGEVNPLSVEDALQVGLALLAAVVECEEADV